MTDAEFYAAHPEVAANVRRDALRVVAAVRQGVARARAEWEAGPRLTPYQEESRRRWLAEELELMRRKLDAARAAGATQAEIAAARAE